jgi:hypothetical protein
MHKSATKCNETIGKWCKNKHGASKIIDTFETFETYQAAQPAQRLRRPGAATAAGVGGSGGQGGTRSGFLVRVWWPPESLARATREERGSGEFSGQSFV